MKLPKVNGELNRWLRLLLIVGVLVWMTRLHLDVQEIKSNRFTSIDWAIESEKIVLAVQELETSHDDYRAEVLGRLVAIERILTEGR